MQALVRSEVRLACRAATHQRAYDQTRGWSAAHTHSALAAATIAAAAAALQPSRCAGNLATAQASRSHPVAAAPIHLSPLAVATHRRCVSVSAAGALPPSRRGRGCARLNAGATARPLHTHSRRQAASDAAPTQTTTATTNAPPAAATAAAASSTPPLPPPPSIPAAAAAPPNFFGGFGGSAPGLFGAAGTPATAFGRGFALPTPPGAAATTAGLGASAAPAATAAPVVPPRFSFSVPSTSSPSSAGSPFSLPGGLKLGGAAAPGRFGWSLPPPATPAAATATAGSAAAATPAPGQTAVPPPTFAAPFGFSLPPPTAAPTAAADSSFPAPPLFSGFQVPPSTGSSFTPFAPQQSKPTLSPAAAIFEAKAAAGTAIPPVTPASTDAAASPATPASAAATPSVPLPFLQYNPTPATPSTSFGNAGLSSDLLSRFAKAGESAIRKSAAAGSIKFGGGAAVAASKPALAFEDVLRVAGMQKKVIEQEQQQELKNDAQDAQADEDPAAGIAEFARDRIERTRPPSDRLGLQARLSMDGVDDPRILADMANDALLALEDEEEAVPAAASSEVVRPTLTLNTDVSLDPRAPLPLYAEGDFPHLSMADWKRLREDAGLSEDMLEYVRYQSEASAKYAAAVVKWRDMQDEVEAEREADRKAQRRAAGRAALEDARAGFVGATSFGRQDEVASRLHASHTHQRGAQETESFEPTMLDRSGGARATRRMLTPFVRAMAEPLESISPHPPALWPLGSRIGYMEMQQQDLVNLARLQKQRKSRLEALDEAAKSLESAADDASIEELQKINQQRGQLTEMITDDAVTLQDLEQVMSELRQSLSDTEKMPTDSILSSRISTLARRAGLGFSEMATIKTQLALEVQGIVKQMGAMPSAWFEQHAKQMERDAEAEDASEVEAEQAAVDDSDALAEIDAQMAAAADSTTLPDISLEPEAEYDEAAEEAEEELATDAVGLTRSILWDAPLSLDGPGTIRDANPNDYPEFVIEDGNRVICFPGEEAFLLDSEGNHIDNERNIIRSRRKLEKAYPMHDFGDADAFREEEDAAHEAEEAAAQAAQEEDMSEEERMRVAEEAEQRRLDRLDDDEFMDATHKVKHVEQTPNERPAKRRSYDEDDDEEADEEEEEEEEYDRVPSASARARSLRDTVLRRVQYSRARSDPFARGREDEYEEEEEEEVASYRGSSRASLDSDSYEDRRNSGKGNEEFKVPKAAKSSGASASKAFGSSSLTDESQLSMDVEQLDFEQSSTNYDSRASKTTERPELEVHSIQTLASFAASMSVSVRDLTGKLRELDLVARGNSGLIKEDVARLLAEEYGFTPVKSAVVQPQELASLRRKSLKSEQYLSLPLRAPVICVMGHVDHGKTTLLDRLRSENRAAGEAGGITQAIGAFRVNLTPDASAPAAPVEVPKDNLEDVESPEERALREEIEAEEAAAKATEALAKASSLVNTSGTAEPHSERPTYATFLDTPGHAAFKNMRAKGASSSCTDLVILVISAVDGLMPQTLEVIQLARKANLPLIIAINKCDVSGADPNAIKKQLFVHDVVVEDMGGEVLSCNISAKTGEGIQQLKELIAVTAEILQLHADRSCPAEAYVIESRIHKKGGCVASILVRNGSIRVGQHFVCGLQHGRIRALHDENDKPIRDAVINPGEAAQLFGLKSLDDLTEDLYIVDSEERAVQVIEERIALLEADESELISDMQAQNQADQKAQAYKIQVTRRKKRVAIRPLTVDEAASKALVDNAVPVLVKADVSGSLEVLMEYFSKLPQDEVMCSIMKQGLGEITVQDVEHAVETGGTDAAGVPLAAIFGFNVKPSADAALLAKQRGLKIYTHAVIYSLWDDIRDVLSERLPTEMVESSVGTASVQQLFPLSGEKKKKLIKAPVVLPASRNPLAHLGADPTPEAVAAAEAVLAEEAKKAAEEAAAAQAEADAPAMVAGCRVKHGKIDSKMKFRVKREEENIIQDLTCVSLRINKDSKPVVEKGLECGIRLSFGFDSRIRVGDTIECYTMVKKEKTLDDAVARGSISEQEGGKFDVTQQAASYQ